MLCKEDCKNGSFKNEFTMGYNLFWRYTCAQNFPMIKMGTTIKYFILRGLHLNHYENMNATSKTFWSQYRGQKEEMRVLKIEQFCFFLPSFVFKAKILKSNYIDAS